MAGFLAQYSDLYQADRHKDLDPLKTAEVSLVRKSSTFLTGKLARGIKGRVHPVSRQISNGIERIQTIEERRGDSSFFRDEDVSSAQRMTEEPGDVARKPIIYKELKTNEVLTPPKAKLLLTARRKR